MLLRLVIGCLSVSMLCGCSHFRSSRHIDMAPFAENTITLVSEIGYGLNHEHALYLRKYMQEAPLVDFAERWGHMRPILRGIAAYSLALVTVSKSNLKESEKLDQLAVFLDRMFRPVVNSPLHEFPLSAAELDAILANIRAQKNFLDGLGAAQPIVDQVANYSGAYLDLIKLSQQEAEGYLMQRITEDNIDVMEFNEWLKEAQGRSFKSLNLLANYRKDLDERFIAEIRIVDPQLNEFLPKTNKLDAAQTKVVEDRLVFRLSELRQLKDQIAADLDNSRLMVQELDQLVIGASENLVRTRATIWVWSRAHSRLASGITDPAKIDMMGIAQRALKAAMPF